MKTGAKWGYITTMGVYAIQPVYIDAQSFSSDMLAAVKDAESGKWGYVDIHGQYAVQPLYDEAEPFSGGYALAHREGSWYLLDKNGGEQFFFAK